MITDISLTGTVVILTSDEGWSKEFPLPISPSPDISWEPNDDLNLTIKGIAFIALPLGSYTINTVTPANVGAAKTALRAVFPDANSGNGGSGTTLYSGDGALAGDRVVDLAGHLLHIVQDGHEFLILNPEANNEQSLLQAFNGTDDGNDAYALMSVTNLQSKVKINADFQDGIKTAYITGTAISGSSTWEYSSDTHTFEGDMILEDLAGVGTRALAVDENGKIVLL